MKYTSVCLSQLSVYYYMLGQFFILSPRGDTIINKDFRGDALPNLHEVFFRKVHIREVLTEHRNH